MFGLQLPEDHTVDHIFEAFDNHFIGTTNETYGRYVCNKRDQKADESVEDYVATLRILATTCNFCECMGDSLLRDRIVLGIRDSSTRKRLLQEGDLTLKACIVMCRAAEATSQQLRSVKLADETSAEACSVSTRDRDRKSAQSKTMQCRYCGQSHKFKKELCPAWGKVCTVVCLCPAWGMVCKTCKTKIISPGVCRGDRGAVST